MKSIAPLLGLLAATACTTLQAQSRPLLDIVLAAYPDEAKLRCTYRAATPQHPLATDYVEAADLVLRGRWANISLNPSANLFYTAQEPGELRQACERTLAGRHIAGELVQWTAASDRRSYHHQLWHDGVPADNESVDRIVAFGDSLSDTGNFHNAAQWMIPAPRSWFLGRFSNGPVWVEYFAGLVDKPLNNWAVGTAETQDSALVDGLESQVASFARYVRKATGYDPARTLFTVLAGANDFMSDNGAGFETVSIATQRLESSLLRIGELGGRKIVLLNLPDIARIPKYRNDSIEGDLVREKARLYNAALPAIAEKVRQATGTEIVLIDLATMFDELLEDPAAAGFTNATESCLDMPTDSKQHYITGRPARAECSPDRYVFWDLVHPTTRVHRLIADKVFAEAAVAWNLRPPSGAGRN